MTARSIPKRTGLLLSSGGCVLALLPAALGSSLPAIVLAGIGFLLVTGGISKNSDSAITVGALCLYGNILFAGLAGVSAIGLLAGALGTVLAWDSATNAVVIHGQLSPQTDSRRTQTLRATVTALIVVMAGLVGILFSLVIVAPGSVAAMAVLLVGALALIAGLTR